MEVGELILFSLCVLVLFLCPLGLDYGVLCHENRRIPSEVLCRMTNMIMFHVDDPSDGGL